MSNVGDTSVHRAQRGNPVRTTAVIIYASFALLILAIPQSVTNWLRDMNENPIQQVLLRGAEGLQAAARGIGLDIPYRAARAKFRALTGKDED